MSTTRSRKRKVDTAEAASDDDVAMGEAECGPPTRKRLRVELRAQRAPRVIDTTAEGQEQLRREETSKDRFEANVRQLLLNGAFDQVDPETAQTKSDLAASQAPSVKQQLFNDLSFQINKSKTEVMALQRFLDQMLQGQAQAQALLQPCPLGGPKQSKNTKQTNGMVQAKQKKAALVSAARRLTSFAAAAKERVCVSRRHLDDVRRLRRQWRLGLVPDAIPPSQRPVVASSHFVIDYGLSASGSSRASIGALQQTEQGTKMELAPFSVNKSMQLVVEELAEVDSEQQQSPEGSKAAAVAYLSFQLCSTIASTEEGVVGVLPVHKLLNNALWSLVTMNVFQDISQECVRSKLPNVRKEENRVKSSPTYKDALSIEVVASDDAPERLAAEDRNSARKQRELLYDLDVLHFVIVRLYLSKYRISRREALDHRAARNPVAKPTQVRVLATTVAIHAHQCLRKQVEGMLDDLSNGLSGSTSLDESTATLCNRQFAAMVVHWLGTGDPIVAAADLIFEECAMGLTVRGVEIDISGYHRTFTNVDEARDHIAARLCSSALGTISKEIRALGKTVTESGHELLCEGLFPGCLVTVEFMPLGNSIKGTVHCKSRGGERTIPWASLPGNTNQAKTCFLLSLHSVDALLAAQSRAQ